MQGRAIHRDLEAESFMATVKPKTIVQLKLDGSCVSHARTDVSSRGLKVTIDEPVERGGTNLSLTPTETLMAALLGCTNVITHKVAAAHGVHLKSMRLRLEADLDRRGVTLAEEIDLPFPRATLYIDVTTDADEASLAKVKRDLGRYCPLSKVVRQAGTKLEEVWSVSR
jgi:putative redox protein